MTTTNYYGSRFQRRFKIKPLVRLIRSGRRGHAPLSSADSNVTLTEAANVRERDDHRAEVGAPVSEAAESEAVPQRQPLPPAVTLTHTRTEEAISRVKLENILREQAIHLVSLLYPERHLTNQRFDVCTSTKNITLSGEAQEFYITRAIAFADASSPTWHVVRQGAGNFSTLIESLESFVSDMRSILETQAARPSRRLTSGPGLASRSDDPLIDLNTHADTGTALSHELPKGL